MSPAPKPPASSSDSQPGLPPVPTGIQRLLRLASLNESFLRELVARRGDVAPVAGVPLTPSEAAVLAAIPEPQLLEMARQMPPPLAPRREFLRQTAATAVVLLGGAALAEGATGCNETSSKDPVEPKRKSQGKDPDQPTRTTRRETDLTGGAAPDEPPERPDASASASTIGAEGPPPPPPPPPPRPDYRLQAPGGANPDMPPNK